jgi:ABC-type sugar transport system ATPase subunit
MAFLEIAGLSKRFGGVVALDGIDLSIVPGEIHSIIGENGAGKSTFLKIISGIVRADSGEVTFQGERITHADPNRLFALGISAAFQETSLFDNLTVAENLFLGRLYDHRGALVDWRTAAEEARRTLTAFGVTDLDVRSKAGQLSAEMRQVLEILKAAKAGAKVISLDEPTASLTKAHIGHLFDLLRRLRAQGVTIIYVSHRLNEVLELSDRITVFRDGAKVGTIGRAEASEGVLHAMMVGRALTSQRAEAVIRSTEAGPIMKVSGLSDGAKVKDVSFDVFEGEVLGIAGLVGAGRSEVAWMLAGLAPKHAGNVEYREHDITRITPQAAIRQGIFYLPEERRQMGLFLTQNLAVNTTISKLEKLTRGIVLDSAREKSLAGQALERLGVRYASLDQTALSLSGGNQQKLLLGKCLFTEPQLLILDEPTKGIDVGSKEEIYCLIGDLSRQGMTVIVISSEVEEICLLSHRVLVMGDGRIIGTFTGDEINESSITACYLQTAASGGSATQPV